MKQFTIHINLSVTPEMAMWLDEIANGGTSTRAGTVRSMLQAIMDDDRRVEQQERAA